MVKRSVGHIAEEKPVLSVEEKPETFNKTIRSIPTRLKTEFEDLKREGKVHGSLNSYMVYALAQQLDRDKIG